MRRKFLLFPLVAVGLALSAAPAFAQQRSPGWGTGPGMPMGRGMMGMMAGCPMMGMSVEGQSSAFIDGRIAFLRAELAITDA